MEPGPKLDALVAERVMGWKKNNCFWNDYNNYAINTDDWGSYYPESLPWAPSRFITHAWEVVEKVGVRIDVVGDIGLAFDVTICVEENGGYNFYSDSADTFSHAICLAALKAVGYDIIPQDKDT